MTGSPDASAPAGPLGHREVLRIAVPIMLSNGTVPMIGFVDTAVVGQLGVPHLIGAVAIGSVIFSMLYWTFSFLRMGTTGLTAQALGARDSREIAGHLMRALVVAIGAGVAIVVLQVPIAALVFWIIGGSAEVEASARTYFAIRIWAAPAGLVSFALLGWLIGLGRAGTAFLITIFVNLTNMGLAIVLVLGLGAGVAGVASAALVAEYAGAVVGVFAAVRLCRELGARAPLADAFDWPRMSRSLRINADITVRSLANYAALTFFTAQGAAAGDVTLAANAVLMNLLNITIYLLDGFAFAAEALVGRAVGARDLDTFRRAVRLTTIWAGALALVLAAVYWITGPFIIAFTAKDAAVQDAARIFLAWAAIAPLFGVWCFQLDGIFTGATRTRDMRNMMVLSLALFFAAWAALAPVPGNHRLWLAYLTFYVFRTITLLARMPALVRATFA